MHWKDPGLGCRQYGSYLSTKKKGISENKDSVLYLLVPYLSRGQGGGGLVET